MKTLIMALSMLISLNANAQVTAMGPGDVGSNSVDSTADATNEDIVVVAKQPDVIGAIVGAECNAKLGLGTLDINIPTKYRGKNVMVMQSLKVDSYALCGSIDGTNRLAQSALSNQSSTIWINQLVIENGFVVSMKFVGVANPKDFYKGIKENFFKGREKTMSWYFDAKTGPGFMKNLNTEQDIANARAIALNAAKK